jgi:hypothetical protein
VDEICVSRDQLDLSSSRHLTWFGEETVPLSAELSRSGSAAAEGHPLIKVIDNSISNGYSRGTRHMRIHRPT